MTNIFKVTIIAVLAYVSFIAINNGMANLDFKNAQTQITAWQQQYKQRSVGDVASVHRQNSDTSNILEQQKYQLALERINAAINKHENPQYLEAKAQLLEWGVRLGLQANKTLTLRQANSLYLQSTALRPTWAATWAALALNKWHLGEYDQNMINYLLNAYQYGKNTPEVQLLWLKFINTLQQSNEPKLKKMMQQLKTPIHYYQNL